MKSYSMREDAVMLDKASSYFVRFAFWAVFMIGIFDAFLSFLRVEGLHDNVFGTHSIINSLAIRARSLFPFTIVFSCGFNRGFVG